MALRLRVDPLRSRRRRSSAWAGATRPGSPVFQAPSAIRSFRAAASGMVKDSRGGRLDKAASFLHWRPLASTGVRSLPGGIHGSTAVRINVIESLASQACLDAHDQATWPADRLWHRALPPGHSPRPLHFRFVVARHGHAIAPWTISSWFRSPHGPGLSLATVGHKPHLSKEK